MEIALKLHSWKSIKRPRWLPEQWLIYLLITISMLAWFLFLYEIENYRPWAWKSRMLKAFEMTVTAHFGLWLATIRTRSKWRFLIAAIFLPTMVGLSILWWMAHPMVGIFVFAGTSWLMVRVIRGK